MVKLTITEALAEIKTIDARLIKKREFAFSHLTRQEQFRDPLEADGGSVKVVAETLQSVADLEQRKVDLRKAINYANDLTDLTIGNTTKTISEWLIWRREVKPAYEQFLVTVIMRIRQMRDDAMKKGFATVTSGDVATKNTDVKININEIELSKEAEELENILGSLDGQLSLKNATTFVSL